MGLRVKLLLCLLCLMLLSMAFLGGSMYWFFVNLSQDKALQYQQTILPSLLRSARAEALSLSEDMAQLAQSPKLLEAMQQLEQLPSQPRVLQGLQAQLNQLVDKHDELKRITLFKSGSDPAVGSEAVGRYVLHVPNFVERGTRALLIAPGTLGAVADQGILRRFVRQGSGEYELQVQAVIRDPKSEAAIGRLLLEAEISNLESLLLANDTPSTKLFLSNDQGDLLVKSREVQFNSLPLLSLQGLQEVDGPERRTNLNINHVDYVLELKSVLPGLWLGVMVDQSNIARVAGNLILYLVPLMAAIFIFAGAVFYWNIKRLVILPIEKLISATKQVAQGNYAPSLDVHSSDELGDLGQSFQEMGKKLENSSLQIQQLAYFDGLTQLPNRTTLKASLSAMVAQAKRRSLQLAVLFIDLDDFKKVNDRLGHDVGDQLLVQVGERIKQALRVSDDVETGFVKAVQENLVSRRGGDEFNAVLYDVSSPTEAAMVAERLIDVINEPMIIDSSHVSVGASIGIAMYPGDGDDAGALLRSSDMAMYEAKALGKNKFYLYTPAINTQVHERLELEQGIIRGLQQDEFELRYQPKINLKTMTVSGLEALIRWSSPERGVVSPTMFVPLSEESQLIHKLGNWVLIEVMRQIRAWEASLPPHLRIALNISARQLAEEGFAQQLFSIARQFAVPLSRLEVELTETSVMVDEVLVRQHLYALRSMGVKVSLDDFGTGYSSLTFLRNLPIDAVKIDRSFVMRLGDSEDSQAIVRSVLELCDKLSLETIAEGVETQEQLALLKEYGCDEGQGYFFARALRAQDVPSFVRSPGFDKPASALVV